MPTGPLQTTVSPWDKLERATFDLLLRRESANRKRNTPETPARFCGNEATAQLNPRVESRSREGRHVRKQQAGRDHGKEESGARGSLDRRTRVAGGQWKPRHHVWTRSPVLQRCASAELTELRVCTRKRAHASAPIEVCRRAELHCLTQRRCGEWAARSCSDSSPNRPPPAAPAHGLHMQMRRT